MSFFQAWNEPNLPYWLGPQWTRARGGWAPASPAIYRRLLNAAYASIKSVQPHAHVLAAGLAPYGDPPGKDRMRPVQFLRALLCLRGPNLQPTSCGSPAKFDGIDAHPYAVTPTIHAFNPDDVSVPDVVRLARVVRAAVRVGHALPRTPKPIWVTEIQWDSSPPDPTGLPPARQAQYLASAFYELWRQGVSHVLWYEARDPRTSSAGSFAGGGLFFRDGRAKPAAVAFRFPFVAIRSAGRSAILWGRAPAAGVVTIEVARGNGWRRLSVLRTTRTGIFYARSRIASRVTLRAKMGGAASYPWSTG